MNWKIKNMVVNPVVDGLTDVVISVEWICEQISEGGFGFVSQTSFIGPVNPNHFIQYKDLTEMDVLQWVWSCGIDKQQVEESVLKQIAEQQHISSLKTLSNPWI